MALTDVPARILPPRIDEDKVPVGQKVVPVSVVSGWVHAGVNPETVDSSPDALDGPGLDSRRKINVSGRGTSMLIACAYKSGGATLTNPVVVAHGISKSQVRDSSQANLEADVYQLLSQTDGTVLQTLVVNNAVDGIAYNDGVSDYKLTAPIKLDLDGCQDLVIGIETAMTESADYGEPFIVVKVLN